jgi:adenylosuccinate lyase
MKDEIIEDLWAVKDQIAEKHNHDVDALVAHLRTRIDQSEPHAKTKHLGTTAEPKD